MKCIILAAGYATRLYPITKNFPKPLLEVNGKSIIDWLIDDLESTNLIDEYIVISNHKFYDSFDNWKNKKDNNKIVVLDDGTTSNENRLGAVKDIEFAIKELNLDDDSIILAGDNLLDFSLNEFISYFNKHNATSIMRYYTDDKNRLRKSANIKIDENDLVVEMIEKPENPISNWCCPAFYILTREDLKKVTFALEDGCGYDAPGSFICWLYDKSPVYAYKMMGSRYDIGTIDTYEKVKKLYKGIEKHY